MAFYFGYAKLAVSYYYFIAYIDVLPQAIEYCFGTTSPEQLKQLKPRTAKQKTPGKLSLTPEFYIKGNCIYFFILPFYFLFYPQLGHYFHTHAGSGVTAVMEKILHGHHFGQVAE